MAEPLLYDAVWLQQQNYENAEAHYQSVLAGTANRGKSSADGSKQSSLKNEIAQTRRHIQNVLKSGGSGGGGADSQVDKRISGLEQENKDLKKVVEDLRSLVGKLESRITNLEKGNKTPSGSSNTTTAAPASQQKAPQAADDDDDDCGLFDSTDEDEAAEAEKLKQERLKAYQEKKSKKPGPIAKSLVTLFVKPWDDETDMKEMERLVRTIAMDGLVWGASQLVPVGYGINKLQIGCVVEDEKVSIDDLQEQITTEFEDHVQSVDIAAFNKL